MKILDVSPRTVDGLRSGCRVRVHNVLNHLAERHEVVFYGERFQEAFHAPHPGGGGVGEEVRARPPGGEGPAGYRQEFHADPLSMGLRRIAESSPVAAPVLSGVSLAVSRPARCRELIRWADVILVEFPWQFGPIRRWAGSSPVVYCSHNIEAHKFRTYPAVRRGPLSALPWLAAIDALEARAVRQADLVVAVSPEDREGFVERYRVDPGRIAVAANAADTRRYRPVDGAGRARARRELGLPDRPTVLFLGSQHPPNVAALAWVRQLADRFPACTFLVVGDVCTPGVEGSLIRTGLVADPSPYLAAADVSLVPIQFGAGTKIKLMESCAAGLPILAFPEAIAGTLLRHQEHLLVAARSLGSLTEGLGRLLTEPALARRLGQAARRLAEEQYDWGASAAVLEQALLLLTEGAGR